MTPRRTKPTDTDQPSTSRPNNSRIEEGNPLGSNSSNFEGNDAIPLDNLKPEKSAAAEMCSNTVTPPVKKPWPKEQIRLALSQLPAGARVLELVASLEGEELKKALEEFQQENLSEYTLADRKLSIPSFANGGVRQASLLAENEDANVTKPSLVLAKWPETCLLVSCWLRRYELVKALLDKGVNIKAQDADGRTPLHLAATSSSANIVQELLGNGADPNEWDFAKEHTALHCAAAVGSVACIQHLVNAGADVDAGLPGRCPLLDAVHSNSPECVKALLVAGAKPNNSHVYTETPLHAAASLGAAETVAVLLGHSADVRGRMGSQKSTPLHLAAVEGSQSCTKLLLDAESEADARNSTGQTALHLAAFAQSTETMDVIIKAGANINAEDDNGRTPLHTAVAKAVRGCEPVKLLLEAGALVNKPDKFGYTPLHTAAINESSRLVLLLLSKEADVTARTKGGISALYWIVRRTPEVIPRFVAQLDQAITLHEHRLSDKDCELKLDFRPLVPGGRGETDLMLCLVEVGKGRILKHPLCESFLHLKWLRIRKFFLFSLIFHSLFVGLFTAHVALEYFFYFKDAKKGLLIWPVALFTFVLACKEIFQLLHGLRIYATRWENWLQWGVICASAAILIKPTSNWQHHVAALGILLVWVELMMIIGRFPMFGLYVQMFTQVSINFFKFLGAYMGLIIGFTFCFNVLHQDYKSFGNPGIAFLKTIIMMSGELEFEDVFFDDKSKIPYPGTTHIMWLVYVVLVTIILTNLMVGLAVSDIQDLRRCAGLDRLVRRAEHVAHLESMLFSKFLDLVPKKIVKALRQGALVLHPPHHCGINIRPNNPRDKRLPRDLKKDVFRIVAERKTESEKRSSNFFTRSTDDVGSSNVELNRLHSETSNSDSTQQQISDLGAELKRCREDIVWQLNFITNMVEDIAGGVGVSLSTAL